MSVFTHADGSGVSKAFICVSVCVILFVCPHDNSKTNDPKVFKLGLGNDLGIAYRWYDFRVKVRVIGLGLGLGLGLQNMLKTIE